MSKKGGISVETQHIFPIIKRWLYSEKEIFLREIVSNACDAVTKLRRLSSLGQAEIPDDYKIVVRVDKDAGTLSVSDNGIGMTAEEVEKYITQIALSGAMDFLEKYEGAPEAGTEGGAKNGIIGHFGLGFYSSFMVADTVDVHTKSFVEGSTGVFWSCGAEGEYEMEDRDRPERGTTVILHINEDESELLEKHKIRSILDKYCAFMPVEIYLESADDKAPEVKEGEEDKEPEAPKPVNDIHPLWTKNPSECGEVEYDEFYHKVFHDWKEPLFHIHINADYPLNFKGILYFPKINSQYDSLEGEVKLYYNQVFVADNIKEVIPEWLLMLKGVLDCPELPLNVSRSYLQNNGYVAKISAHIIKKVSDKLSSLFNTERSEYEGFWGDIKTFIEYGCIRDRKFYDKVKDIILYKTTDGTYKTLSEYVGEGEDKKSTVYYATDVSQQAVYISMFTKRGHEVVVLDNMIEQQFISMQESDGVKFVRVDAESGALGGESEADASEKLSGLFKKASGSEKLTVKVRELGHDSPPAILNVSEQSRRIADMMRQYSRMDESMAGMAVPDADTVLVLNTSSPVVSKLESADGESAEELAKHVYSLATLSHRRLSATELEEFLSRSWKLVEGMQA
ncbi:MAG: molecular chaperone HtpG [Eubacteriales bacterium]